MLADITLEAALKALAAPWVTDDRGPDGVSALVLPVAEVRSVLRDPAPEVCAMAATRLEVALGADYGHALASAARHAALR